MDNMEEESKDTQKSSPTSTLNPLAKNVKKNPAHSRRSISREDVPSPYKDKEETLDERASDFTDNPLSRKSSRSAADLEDSRDEEGFSLHVKDLSFTPDRQPLFIYLEYIRRELDRLGLSWIMPFYKGMTRKQQLTGYELFNVSFKAKSGELIALLGDPGDRYEVIQLLTGRKKTGRFDGEISLTGSKISMNSYYYDHVTYVKMTPLFIPGLTYYEMIHYAARLRLDAYPEIVNEHVEEVMRIMKLTHVKTRKIPEYPVARGEVGSEFRRLSIALEIVHAPKVIVIDEPTLDFDPAVSLKLMGCLKELAHKGHIVICSTRKPSHAEFFLLDRVVLLSEGYVIYNSSPENAKKYFCGRSMAYELRSGVEMVDFLLDVSTGVERPRGQRAALLPSIMMEKFEASDFFDEPRFDANSHVSAFDKKFFKYYGMLRGFKFQSYMAMFRHGVTVFERAIVTKIKDVNAIKTGFGGAILIALITGYLQYGQGHYGRYASTFFGIGYAGTYNTAGSYFFLSMLSLAFPFKDTHIFCQKLALFRYERDSGYVGQLPFFVAAVISEVPFYLLQYFIFSTMFFFLQRAGKGADKWQFFVSTFMLGGMVGVSMAYMMAAIFRKELNVRDWFFVVILFMVMLSGFVVQKGLQRHYMQDLSQINPARWIFEALLEWKYSWYEDGANFLTQYEFNTFDHSKIGSILVNFIIVINCITYLFLFPFPILLSRVAQHRRRTESSKRASRSSIGEIADLMNAANMPPRRSTRTSEQPVQPMLFMRESTVTGRASKLSVSVSQTGEEDTKHGPTVMFKDITYKVKDNTSPVGYKTVLDHVCGQFDWGKLSMIMGAPESGKSSLLHILAADIRPGTEIEGTVLLNGKKPDPSLKPFEGRGFVPMENPQLQDLNVQEVLTFAMKLRCYNRKGLRVVDDNVKATMELLHLTDISGKKVNQLTSGEYKRLSIAEEVVHGPKLLYMDEPTTGVSLIEVSVLMLCFREMVNADRTVIATIHQPTAETFKLFDTLMLLSKGRVLYFGKPEDAVNFFVQSPHQYNSTQYKNPAEFLSDISAGHLTDRGGEIVDAALLNEYYRSTEDYRRLRQRLKDKVGGDDEDSVSESASPYAARSSSPNKNPIRSSNNAASRTESFDIEATEDHEKVVNQLKKSPNVLYLAFRSLLFDVLLKVPTWEEIVHHMFKRRILLHRSCLALAKRYTLFISSMVANVCLCAWFVWIVRDAEVSAVLGLFAIGAMFLIFTNVLFVFFIYTAHQVFLKEHSRGLYSTLAHFSVNSWPLYFLRALNAIVYACFFVKGLVIDDSTKKFGFNIFLYIVYFIVTTALSEALIYGSSNVASNYGSISLVATLNFFFSGLFVKSQSLPAWLAPWVPSISPIRWIAQTAFINLYKDDHETFPTFPGTNYSNYKGFLTLFGWGGKTKWYCLGMLIIMFVAWRVIGLFVMGLTAFMAPGSRQVKHRTVE